ncbi:MAG TPA: hypothetical protein DCY15_04085 [Ruminococcaceae bacterium]|nr:hypothetical protein [Oscillospiraceae bacterium]
MKNKTDIIYKLPLFVSLFALLAAVPLRVYQYFKVLEPETGFYSSNDISVYVMYILLGAAMLLSVLIPLINKKKLITVTSVKKSPAFLVFSLILAVTIIIDSAGQLMDYFDLYDAASAAGGTVTEYVKNQGGTFLLLQAVSGAVAAVYFFVSGLSVSLGNSDGSRLKILGLTPVLWYIFKLLYRFKRTISFTNVSDLMLELFAIVFLMMFFFALAQTVAKIDAQTVFWKIFAYGVPAAMFALMCFLPRFIVMIIGKSELLNTHYGVSYSDLGVAAYIIYNLLSRMKARTADSEE